LNIEQKVVFKCTNNKFTIKSSSLLFDNLGFLTECTNDSEYVANKTWDLRIDDKVYLYLDNLSNDIPFGILYFANGQSICQFKFQETLNLNRLDIKFKDSKGNDYNFYNLSHNLSFIVTIN
jgi:hypothetical protein